MQTQSIMANHEAKVWTDVAQLYDRIVPQLPYYRELVQKMVDAMDPAPAVLDCGCGTGFLSIALANAGHVVHGIDNSAGMLQRARNNLAQAPSAVRCRVSLAEGDPVELGTLFPAPNRFDGVVCNNVLFFVADPDAVLTQLLRVVKPGGVVALSGPIPGADIELLAQVARQHFRQRGMDETSGDDLDNFLEFSRTLQRSGHRNTYTKGQLEALLSAVGFRSIVRSDQDTYCGQSYFVCAMK